MKIRATLSLILIIFTCGFPYAQPSDTKYYEMRTYHCHEGKRPDLIKRFEEHTLRLFQKNGIENVAYFIPTDENINSLTFILSYPDQSSRDVLWKKFGNDPEWQAARKESESNGPLVEKVDQVFMTVAPELATTTIRKGATPYGVFELRTYHLHPGRVDAINARFRDHTRKIFENHGMTNVVYWYTVEADGGQPKLVYLLAHKSQEAAKESWNAFREDPAWKKARDESELTGPIVQKIESVYLQALPFSPLK